MAVEDKRWWLWRPPREAKYIGGYVPRRDAAEKASGWHKYVNDLEFPGILYAKPLRSPYTNCIIKKMDASRAEKVPGVIAVIRWDDPWFKDKWPGMNYASPPEYIPPAMAAEFREITVVPYLMDRAWWYGQPVGAIVIAETEESCDEALKILSKDTEWEELPFCLDWEKVEECEFPIRPEWEKYSAVAKGNIELPPVDWMIGDVEKGFNEADHIIEFTVRWDPGNTWALPAPFCAIAQWSDGRVKIWTNAQIACVAKYAIADWLGIPESSIDMEAPYSPATFGGIALSAGIAITVLAVMLSGRFKGKPVKVLDDHTRWEGFEHVLGTYKFKVGFKNDGTITALSIRTIAVAPNFGAGILHNVLDGTKIPSISFHGEYPMINTGIRMCSKERAPTCLIHQMIIAHVADELGMDPTEVALRNDGWEGHDMEWVYENIAREQGFNISKWSLKECMKIGKKLIGWDEKWHPPGTMRLPNGKYHGIGFGATVAWSHVPFFTRAGMFPYNLPLRIYMSLTSDGSLRVVGHRSDTGVGSDGNYSMVVADEIGLRYEDVNWDGFSLKDFYLAPMGASSGTASNLSFIVYAARKMRRKILEAATELAQFKGKKLEELDIRDSVVFEKANPDNKVPVSQVAFRRGLCVTVSLRITTRSSKRTPIHGQTSHFHGSRGRPRYW
ncbi:MAG: molybdopterin cofactor-binding domain-containing protein [Candidatus Bathyarchaeia archaeon]